jgi:hypothetical protein
MCLLMLAVMVLQIVPPKLVRITRPAPHTCCCAAMGGPCGCENCNKQQECICPAWVNSAMACLATDDGLVPHRPLLAMLPDPDQMALQRSDKPVPPPPISPPCFV